MTEPTVTRVHPNSAGCWIEGSRGWTAIARLAEIAWQLGFPMDSEDSKRWDAYMAGSDDPGLREAMTDLADEAEAWLNANVAPERYAFGWHDGEFFLCPTCDDGTCDDDTCWHHVWA